MKCPNSRSMAGLCLALSLSLLSSSAMSSPRISESIESKRATESNEIDKVRLRNILCDQVETSKGLRMRNFASRIEPRGASLGICQTGVVALQEAGYLSYYALRLMRDGRMKVVWIPARRDDVAKIFTDRGSREIALDLLDNAEQKIREKGWRFSAYNFASLYCRPSEVPRVGGPCHAYAMKVVRLYAEE